MFVIILTFSGLLLKPFDQHFIAPLTWCQLASVCNHTGIPECGKRLSDKTTKTFLDECDLYEYNCDYNEVFNKIDMSACEQTTTKMDTEPTMLVTNVTESTTTTTTTTIRTRTAENYATTRVEVTSIETSTTGPQTDNVSDASNCTRHKSTTNSMVYSTTEASSNTFATTITTQRDITTLRSTTVNQLSSIAYNCTRNQSHTSTTQISTIEPFYTTALSVPSSTISTLSTSSVETILTATQDTTLAESTITQYTTTTAGFNCTRKGKKTPVTQIASQSMTTIASHNSEDHTVTPIKDNDKQKTPTSVISSTKPIECIQYPKDCNRPSTWETTSKGETRDFFQILREKFGTRVKLLKATTHWPKQAPFLRNPYYFETFKFGRHSEG